MTYDEITLELKNVIHKEKGKTYFTFETRVGDMASDCLKFIEENTCNQLRIPFEWIDLETRLPNPNEWVLASMKFVEKGEYGTPIVARLRDGKWYSSERGYIPSELFIALKITHWSPLPANPEVKK